MIKIICFILDRVNIEFERKVIIFLENNYPMLAHRIKFYYSLEEKIIYVRNFLKENKIVISFCGIHNTGKTTMLEELSKILGIKKMVEQARCFLPMLLNGNITAAQFQEATDIYYRKSWETLQRTNESFICDRTFNENISYAKATLNEEESKERRFQPYYYDLIINMNELPLDSSKERRPFTIEEENKIRKNIDKTLKIYLMRKLNILEINSMEFEERKTIIINELYEICKSRDNER